MSDKLKNIVVTVVLALYIMAFTLMCLFHAPVDVSVSERRKLAQLPLATWEGVWGRDAIEAFEDYTLDQFPMRETFRKIKANVLYNIFCQKDNNDIYVADGMAVKIEYPLNEGSVLDAAKKLTGIHDTYLSGNHISTYYAIIPDKNYFVAGKYGYPAMDYNKLVSIMNDNIDKSDMVYIDLFDCLEADDYYRTDVHWSQDRLGDAVDKIGSSMGFPDKFSNTSYAINEYKPYYGVYYGQSALTFPADTIYYLTNDTIDSCRVYNYETGETTDVYVIEKLDGMDPYDIFLSGAAALLVVDNPNAGTGRELVLFRDSFGSGIAPLLLEAYSKVTLVDIRYIDSSLLGQLIDFGGNAAGRDERLDVLFLYSTLVLNNSAMLK